jgi:hypothetical protein
MASSIRDRDLLDAPVCQITLLIICLRGRSVLWRHECENRNSSCCHVLCRIAT